MKKVFLLILCGIFLLTGCSSRARELETSAIIKALAFDKAKEGYEITAYIAGAEKQDIISLKAGSVGEGLYRLNTETERKIFLGKIQVVLISAEFREIEEILLALYSSREVRKSAKVLILQGSAKEALSYQGLYAETATDIEKTAENAEKHGNHSAVTLYGAVNGMAAEQGICVFPVAKMEEENLVVYRDAVYEKYRLLQTLSSQETLGCALLRGAENAYFSEGEVSCALREISAEHCSENGKNIIRLRCSYRILSAGSAAWETDTAIAEELEKAVRAAYETAQKLNVNFLELYPCDVSLPAEIIVKAVPASNDYPLRGVVRK